MLPAALDLWIYIELRDSNGFNCILLARIEKLSVFIYVLVTLGNCNWLENHLRFFSFGIATHMGATIEHCTS